jgi:Protein of unknown function (DUF4012)
MRRTIVVAVVALAAVVTALGAYVAWSAGRPLAAARAALSGSAGRLERSDLATARAELHRARGALDTLPAHLLGAVPVARQNIAAMRAAADAAIPVVDAGLDLDARVASVGRAGLVQDGVIRIAAIESLADPVERERRALEDLERVLQRHRNGWLLPPLWDEVAAQLERARRLRRGSEHAVAALRLAPELLGARGPRTYLVTMVNNAELRGGGGILSGIGSLTVDHGRFHLGRFYYYRALADDPPYRSVEAPADYARHFRRYHAATTRWVATSSSPDIPDVAVVARRLFELSAGTSTDGVLLVDPRGLAALMPEHATVDVPATSTQLSRKELPRFVYSRAYERLEGPPARRDALIGVGESAFGQMVNGRIGGSEVLDSVARAVAGGHLRFVPAAARARDTFGAMGVEGELGSPAVDGTLVTVQNYGGNKLDFWARRTVRHYCDLGTGTTADCSTGVTIRNEVPMGLPRFVYQYKPYGTFRDYVEVYVPREADLTDVDVDGRPARFFTAEEDGYTAVGTYVEVARSGRVDVSVRYDLPLGPDGYALELRPQPLTHDATAEVAVTVPSSWIVEGPGRLDDGVLRFSKSLDETRSWTIKPDGRSGIPALWAGITRFWSEPLL